MGMLLLFKEIIENNILVSQEKTIQLIERKISNYKSSIASRGHSYSIRRMNARYDVQAYLEERLYGISQLETLQSILQEANENWDDFKNRLSNILESNLKIRSSET